MASKDRAQDVRQSVDDTSKAEHGVGIVVETLPLAFARARRLKKQRRSAAKTAADLNRDTFDLEARHADIEETQAMSLERLQELEAKDTRRKWLRDARLILTNVKGKMANPPSQYRLFAYVYKRWRDEGEPDQGVPLTINQLAKAVHLNRDYVRVLIEMWFASVVHIEHRRPKPTLYRPKCP
jgi:hypothetical protein